MHPSLNLCVYTVNNNMPIVLFHAYSSKTMNNQLELPSGEQVLSKTLLMVQFDGLMV